jgi:hypothetical protein
MQAKCAQSLLPSLQRMQKSGSAIPMQSQAPPSASVRMPPSNSDKELPLDALEREVPPQAASATIKSNLAAFMPGR